MRHLTKAQLIQAAQLAEKHDYNRQLETELLRPLPEGKYRIVFSRIHRHRHVRPCEPHLRLMLQLPTVETAGKKKPDWCYPCVDVPLAFARSLSLAA